MLFKIYFCFILLNIILLELMFLRVKNNKTLKEFFVNRLKQNTKDHDGKWIKKAKLLLVLCIPIVHILTACGFACMFIMDENKLMKMFR